MAKRVQPSLFATWQKDRFAFGGSKLGRAHARGKRPFSKKLAMHVVLRSSQATGARSLLNQGRKIEAIVYDEAAKRGVKLHGGANSGNHLHLLVQAPSRDHLSAFLRAISGRIAMIVSGACKGNPLSNKKTKGFWDQRPFSRLVSLGQDFTNVLRYIVLNSTEVAKFSRALTRQMFAEIREHLRQGRLLRSPRLMAAGFC